jgi:hypothetical protein
MAFPVHVSEVPEFDLRGDCVHVVWRDAECYVPVPICQAAIGRCNRTLDEWHEKKRGAVVPFRAPVAAE